MNNCDTLKRGFMLNYQTVTQRSAAKLRKYYENCDYRLCEYSLGTKLMWKEVLHPEWAEAAGCLIVRNEFQGRKVYDYPVAGPGGDIDAALTLIEQDCFEAGIPLGISIVPESKSVHLLHRYPYVHVYNIRTWNDYVYHSDSLSNFAGRKYSKQRNHIHKFEKVCPGAVFRKLTKADMPLIEQFWEDYDKEFPKDNQKGAVKELKNAKRLLKMVEKPYFRCGGLFDGEKMIALALGEKCGETMIVHIEKALYSYEGVYPAFVMAFAKAFGSDVSYINREDDAADRGLRMSKLQYLPAYLAPKYVFRPYNDLQEHVHEIPTLTTERLTLDAITPDDIDRYNEIVLDQERNRWWGYDDVGSLKEPLGRNSFYDVAMEDFRRHNAINFAVRLNGEMIGEAVLYNFDFRGGAELGCRIASQYAGYGYGSEAYQAVIRWALYTVHMVRIVGKCFLENEASYKMLSASMHKTGKDDTYYYFETQV